MLESLPLALMIPRPWSLIALLSDPDPLVLIIRVLRPNNTAWADDLEKYGSGFQLLQFFLTTADFRLLLVQVFLYAPRRGFYDFSSSFCSFCDAANLQSFKNNEVGEAKLG